MYQVAVTRAFEAMHRLVGGDWGVENRLHSHHYRVEASLSTETLDRHGYVVDIEQLDRVMDGMVRRWAGRSLNDLPEFSCLNPSLEHFSRIWCKALAAHFKDRNLTCFRVRIWEDEGAWASYTEGR